MRTNVLVLTIIYSTFSTYVCAKNPMVGGAPMYANKTIVENAVNSKDHTTLVAAVKAAGLVDTLSGPGPFTVFAPTNAAFAKLPPGTVETLVKPENKATLTKILTYHVVPGVYTAKDLVALAKKGGGQGQLTTVEGDPITVIVEDSKVLLEDLNGQKTAITISNVSQSNGIIHVVNNVLGTTRNKVISDTTTGPSVLSQEDLQNLFPWPPPPPTTSFTFSPQALSVLSRNKTLGNIGDFIKGALYSKGYSDIYHFSQNSGRGFVLVTRNERINDAGGSENEGRWTTDVKIAEHFSINNYKAALLNQLVGRFRTSVIIVSKDLSPPNGQQMDFNVVKAWRSKGQLALPQIYYKIPFDKDYRVSVLVYEFMKKQNRDIVFVDSQSSNISSYTHIKALGLAPEDLK